MPKFLVPELDTVWRFTADWEFPESFGRRHDNIELVSNFGLGSLTEWPPYRDYKGPGFWRWTDELSAEYEAWEAARLKAVDAKFPAGTVVVFDRYHISHSGDHAITLRVLGSPDPRLMNKKAGGTGKGKFRFYLRAEELNTFPEMERLQ